MFNLNVTIERHAAEMTSMSQQLNELFSSMVSNSNTLNSIYYENGWMPTGVLTWNKCWTIL